MRIDLKRVREEPFAWSEELIIPPEALDCSELTSLSTVQCGGRVEFAAPAFVLRAELSYEQSLSCNRCLEPFSEKVLCPVELVVLVGDEEPELEERELEERDLDVMTVDTEELDTELVVREQIQLNLPMKPLCSSDCLGLCPRCGGNRNRGECQCGDEKSDSRWAALEALRDRLPSS